MGLGAGNLSVRLLCLPRRHTTNNNKNNNPMSALNMDPDDRWYDTPSPAALRRSVLAVAIASSIALAAGGPPAALQESGLSPLVVEVALGTVLLVAAFGGLWGCCWAGARTAGGAREAYGKVASDDREAHEVELRPFVGGDGGGGGGAGGRGTDDDDDDDGDEGYWNGGARRGDGDYLDEEDGYLADEGETERDDGRKAGTGAAPPPPRRGARVGFSTLPPARHSYAPSPTPPPPARGGTGDGKAAGRGTTAAVAAAAAGAAGEGNKAGPREAPPAQSLFPAGHTVEL